MRNSTRYSIGNQDTLARIAMLIVITRLITGVSNLRLSLVTIHNNYETKERDRKREGQRETHNVNVIVMRVNIQKCLYK